MRGPRLLGVVVVSALTGAVAGGAVLVSRDQAPERELVTSASLEDVSSTPTTGTSTSAQSPWAGDSQASPTGSDPAIATTPPSASSSTSPSPTAGPLIREGAMVPVGAPVIAAALETVDMPGASGDVVAGAAIFRNPDHPEQSLIIAGNKSPSGGLTVYRLNGSIASTTPTGSAIGNVDVRIVRIGAQRAVLVGANDRTNGTIKFWALNPATGALTSLDARTITTGLAGGTYGFSLGRSADGRHVYAFVTSGESAGGVVQQYELWSDKGRLDAVLVRTLTVGTLSEGCAVDDTAGALYIADAVGIWRYGLDPSTSSTRTLVDRVGGGHLVAAVKGLAVVRGRTGSGVLIASSKGDSTFSAYGADGGAFRGSFKVSAGADGVTSPAGVAAAAGDFGPNLRHGVLVVHDSDDQTTTGAAGTTSNLKVVDLARIIDLDAVPVASASSTTAAATTSSTTASTATAATSTTAAPTALSVNGIVVQTKYGAVQVRVTATGGKITAAEAIQHPSGDSENDAINNRAVPILNSEVVAAQSAQIDAVSGATITSNAYKESLQAALDSAHIQPAG